MCMEKLHNLNNENVKTKLLKIMYILGQLSIQKKKTAKKLGDWDLEEQIWRN